MSIHGISIKNFRGIELREITVGPSGVIISGRNGGGKTSTLKALEAALLARDIGPDAIRHGADKAEIVIDTDKASVRRAITKNGSQLTVKTTDGDTKSKPATWLAEMFGASIDPLGLLRASKKERRAMVLAASPCAVTVESLRKWDPELPADTRVDGHGLDVIERVHKARYDQRTTANAKAKAARAEADRQFAAARGLPGSEDGPDFDAAVRARRDADDELSALEAQDAQAKAAVARTASTREKIAELRAAAASLQTSKHEVSAADDAQFSALQVVGSLREQIDALRARLAEAERVHAGLVEKHAQLKAGHSRSAALEAQAATLESAIAEAGPAPVDPAQLEAARDAAKSIAATHEAARLAEIKRRALAEAERAAGLAKSAESEADKLDRIVKALADDAPRELIASSGGIEGLTLDGDEISFQGVRLDGLCGAQQIHLCVAIAKAAGAKGKVLVVDGIERLDPEQLDVFREAATADGWQVFATQVARGDVKVEDITQAAGSL